MRVLVHVSDIRVVFRTESTSTRSPQEMWPQTSPSCTKLLSISRTIPKKQSTSQRMDESLLRTFWQWRTYRGKHHHLHCAIHWRAQQVFCSRSFSGEAGADLSEVWRMLFWRHPQFSTYFCGSQGMIDWPCVALLMLLVSGLVPLPAVKMRYT